MRSKIFILTLLVFVVPLSSGYATTLIGAIPGYEVSGGSVQANVDISYFRAYDASLESIRAIGGISEDNKSKGWVKTQLHHHYVTVHIEKLADGTVQITVSARRDAAPKAQYAQDILAGIVERIKQQPLWLR